MIFLPFLMSLQSKIRLSFQGIWTASSREYDYLSRAHDIWHPHRNLDIYLKQDISNFPKHLISLPLKNFWYISNTELLPFHSTCYLSKAGYGLFKRIDIYVKYSKTLDTPLKLDMSTLIEHLKMQDMFTIQEHLISV